jgi:hypothetical protein
MKITIVLIAVLSIISIVEGLKSTDICFKQHECDGKLCTLSDCIGLLSYDCDKYQCTVDAETCDEFYTMKDEINYKKNSKLEKALTEGLMKGISFASKRLKKFEQLTKQIRVCSNNSE